MDQNDISKWCDMDTTNYNFFFSGKGFLHVRFFWRAVFLCPLRWYSFLRQGIVFLKSKVVVMFQRLSFSASRTEPSEEHSYLI